MQPVVVVVPVVALYRCSCVWYCQSTCSRHAMNIWRPASVMSSPEFTKRCRRCARVAWVALFLVTLSAAEARRAQEGAVGGDMCFMLTAHFLYANACMKGLKVGCADQRVQ
eukprot:127561-Prorocentrum_minimum.AAC.1